MTTRAKVMWLSPSEGGRASLPDGTRYVTISKFPDDGPRWPDGAWSVVLDFDQPPSLQGTPSLGRASFLVENAPQDRLRPGTRFDLHEGLRKVATVELVGDT
jgi:hypothetical protein